MIIQIVVSVITAAAAIIALIISVVQISKSNKQALFDRRLNAVLTVRWMMLLCKQHAESCKEYLVKLEEGPIVNMAQFFKDMTNTHFFEDVQDIIDSTQDVERRRIFIKKMEELRGLSTEITLIFPPNIGYEIADFVYYYSEMLVFMFKYQSCYDWIIAKCAGENVGQDKNNDLLFSNWKQMMNYMKGTFELYKKLEKDFVLKKAESKIKL